MGLRTAVERIRGELVAQERSDPTIGFDIWQWMFGQVFAQGTNQTYIKNAQEEIGPFFTGLSRGAFKQNGVVFACISNRMDLFSEARFTFRRLRSSRPSGLFANPDLRILETPWTGATTGDLLSRMLLYHDIAGNAYVVRRKNQLSVLRPDWVTIIGGVRGGRPTDAGVWDVDAEVLGYSYQPGGPGSGNDPVVYLPEEVAHFASRPDPELRFLGMSWLTPVIREIMADKAATDHKLRFFEHAATPNMVVKLDVQDLEVYRKWIEVFEQKHAGASNAYKTMFLGAGADATVVGANLQQMDFKVTQGAGETRIAAAAGVPPVVVGLSEGLAAATYSNYSQARRRFADQTIRPLWRNVCGSLANIINVPPDAQLWYDDRDIAALSEDAKDEAEIQVQQAAAIKQLIDAGFESSSVVNAVTNNDYSQLQHTGMFSVQLQPAGSVGEGKGALVQGVPTPDNSPAKQQPALPPAPPQREWPQLTLHMPEIHVHQPDIHTPVTVEPVRFEEGAFKVDVTTPDVKPPDITLTVQQPDKPTKKRLSLPSGERATVTDEDGKTLIEFDDGRTATIEAE